MHFPVLVITDTKPDEGMLAELFAPYKANDRGGGEWDSYEVGGCCTGWLDGYHPRQDPRNVEVCNLCKGTGNGSINPGVIGRYNVLLEIASPRPDACIGCSGTGWAFKNDLVRHPGDCIQIKDLVGIANQIKPTAAVLKNGRWHGYGYDPRQGIVEWQSEFAKLLKSLPAETWLTIVDCHV